MKKRSHIYFIYFYEKHWSNGFVNPPRSSFDWLAPWEITYNFIELITFESKIHHFQSNLLLICQFHGFYDYIQSCLSIFLTENNQFFEFDALKIVTRCETTWGNKDFRMKGVQGYQTWGSWHHSERRFDSEIDLSWSIWTQFRTFSGRDSLSTTRWCAPCS
jgi:hypothetical protein